MLQSPFAETLRKKIAACIREIEVTIRGNANYRDDWGAAQRICNELQQLQKETNGTPVIDKVIKLAAPLKDSSPKLYSLLIKLQDHLRTNDLIPELTAVQLASDGKNLIGFNRQNQLTLFNYSMRRANVTLSDAEILNFYTDNEHLITLHADGKIWHRAWQQGVLSEARMLCDLKNSLYMLGNIKTIFPYHNCMRFKASPRGYTLLIQFVYQHQYNPTSEIFFWVFQFDWNFKEIRFDWDNASGSDLYLYTFLYAACEAKIIPISIIQPTAEAEIIPVSTIKTKRCYFDNTYPAGKSFKRIGDPAAPDIQLNGTTGEHSILISLSGSNTLHSVILFNWQQGNERRHRFFFESGKLLAFTPANRTIPIAGRYDQITLLQLSPCQRYAIVGSHDGHGSHLNLIDCSAPQPNVPPLAAVKNLPAKPCFSPDGKIVFILTSLASPGSDDVLTLQAWSLENRARIFTHPLQKNGQPVKHDPKIKSIILQTISKLEIMVIFNFETACEVLTVRW